jgi:hypothetical protein
MGLEIVGSTRAIGADPFEPADAMLNLMSDQTLTSTAPTPRVVQREGVTTANGTWTEARRQ